MRPLLGERWNRNRKRGGRGGTPFTDSMVVWDNASEGINTIAIVDVAIPGAVVYVGNLAFATYDLTTSIGPISSLPGLFVHDYATTLGNFTMTSVTGNATFTATVSPAAVPEPASIMLLATGVATLVGGRSRRRRSTPDITQPQ